MGYANPSQVTGGIHIRQWSRAYIFAEATNKTDRIVFVNIDACMGTQAMKIEVSTVCDYTICTCSCRQTTVSRVNEFFVNMVNTNITAELRTLRTYIRYYCSIMNIIMIWLKQLSAIGC